MFLKFCAAIFLRFKTIAKFRKDSYGSFNFIINWSNANLDGTDVNLNQSGSYEICHAAGKTNTGICNNISVRLVAGDKIFYMTVTNSNGSVSLLRDLTLLKSGSAGYATAIVPGDFYTECDVAFISTRERIR